MVDRCGRQWVECRAVVVQQGEVFRAGVLRAVHAAPEARPHTLSRPPAPVSPRNTNAGATPINLHIICLRNYSTNTKLEIVRLIQIFKCLFKYSSICFEKGIVLGQKFHL